MKDLLNVMSKFLVLGMSIEDVVRASTSRPAQVIKRRDLGQIGAGAEADVAVMRVREGSLRFVDVGGGRLNGGKNLQCELAVRAGKVVWDSNGISRPPWK